MFHISVLGTVEVRRDGQIEEQGFFLALGSSSSSPKWAPSSDPDDRDIVYSIDYERGFDILKYTGEL